jgi:hypothetical protein
VTRRFERTDYDSAERGLRLLLRSWDPIGVFGDEDGVDPWPEDEYDCLIPGILTRLRAGDGEDELRAFLGHEQVTHFGITPRTAVDERFARELVSWWALRASGATGA